MDIQIQLLFPHRMKHVRTAVNSNYLSYLKIDLTYMHTLAEHFQFEFDHVSEEKIKEKLLFLSELLWNIQWLLCSIVINNVYSHYIKYLHHISNCASFKYTL